MALGSVPAIVLDHVCQLNDVFPFFIFLAAFKGMFVFPSQSGFAVFTVNVCDRVQPREQHSLLRRPAAHVNH